MEERELIKASEVVRILGVSLQQVYRMTWDGQLTRVPYGKQWRWRRSEVEDYRDNGAPPQTKARKAVAA